MKYFIPTPCTCEELKSTYRKLAMQYHPDCGGSTEAMQAVNAEYKILFDRLKNTHKNAQGETYKASAATNETPEQFIEIIDKLIHFEGIHIEIIGMFIWVSGNTRPYKDQLKELTFRWSHNKSAWYLAPEGYKKRNRKRYEMEDIRKMYGSQEVETHPFNKIAAAI